MNQNQKKLQMNRALSIALSLLVVVAVCVTIIAVGAAKKNKPGSSTASTSSTSRSSTSTSRTTASTSTAEKEQPNTSASAEKITFIAPMTAGNIIKEWSADIPVFSNTMEDYRLHLGVDISAAAGTPVYAVADGTVTKVFSDPFLGRTVEVTHTGGVISIYSNLSASDIAVSVGDNVRSGDRIGLVGDTSLSELADEPHLHFGVRVDGVGVNPLDYISDESKESSLGISGT